MRILFVVESTTAGVRTQVFTLASAIDQRRYAVTVACPPERAQSYGDRFFVGDLERARIPVVHVPMSRSIRPADDARALAALVQIIRREQIDLVHAHSSKAGFLGRVAARVAGVPSVYTPHGLYFLGLRSPLKRRFFLLLEQLAGRLGDRVIAVSPGEYAHAQRAHIALAERIVCIENGIQPPQLPDDYRRTAMRASLGAGDGPLIGTVARMSAQKDPRLFLEAARDLLGAVPAARFVWCGSGDLQPQADAWASELGVAHAVRFLGHREDALAVMAALDCFWLTSAYEGLPTVLMEAMALGVPIVASDAVGTRDLLRGQAGLLAPAQRPDAIASATQMLLARDDRRAAMLRTGAAWVRERWSAARMAGATMALYDQVLKIQPQAMPDTIAYGAL